MNKLLTPDFAFPSIDSLAPSFFTDRGIKAVFLDIDNTLVPPCTPVPDEKCDNFVYSLIDAGIKVCLVSNNKASRVNAFNKYNVYSSHRSAKPFPFAYLRLLKKLKLSKNEAAAVGDQLLSDIWGASSIGILTVYVDPIKPGNEGWFVWLKRKIEAPILRKLKKSGDFYGKIV